MRLGDLRGLEVVDRSEPAYLGVVFRVDGDIEEKTGLLHDLHLETRRGLFGARQRIPWQAIEKVGKELIIVNMDSEAHATAVNFTATPRLPGPTRRVSRAMGFPEASPWPDYSRKRRIER